MGAEEMKEVVERSREAGERAIGLTTAIFAVLLAVSTMLSHRAETEEVLKETQAADLWAYYQAKDIRNHAFDSDSQLAMLLGEKAAQTAADFHAQAVKQKADADKIQKVAESLGEEVGVIGRKAGYYDTAELFLEIAIVLSSISLIASSRIYWKVSFVFAAVGVASVIWGLLAIH
jgi:hypothetical protein